MTRRNNSDKQKAVALDYDHGKDRVPKVSAKGSGHVAERIMKIAVDNNIPLYRDYDLCEALFLFDEETEIPEELYAAVARVLAFVYRTNKNFGGAAGN